MDGREQWPCRPVFARGRSAACPLSKRQFLYKKQHDLDYTRVPQSDTV